MDNMLSHPGTKLQVIIREKGLTQKAFASILGKKVSEVNELLKGKRNITIQRDYLLHQTLGTPIKYRILKQIDYDYSLIDIDEHASNNENTLDIGIEDNESNQTQDVIKNDNKEPNQHSEASTNEVENPLINEEKIEEAGTNSKGDDDLQNRARIFRSF